MRRALVPLAVFALACSAHDSGPDSGTAKEPPKPPAALGSISSVQLLMDCGGEDWPEPEPKAAAKSRAAPSAAAEQSMLDPGLADSDEAPGARAPGFAADSNDFGGCQQSQMMMAFTASTVDGATVDVREVRLTFKGHELGTLKPRRAKIWNENGGYERWDKRLTGATAIKVSFDLADPDWGAVDRKLKEVDLLDKTENKADGSATKDARRSGPVGESWGRMFVLEADVDIDGISQTIRSGEFVREEVHMVVT